jgi:IS30 family transposase
VVAGYTQLSEAERNQIEALWRAGHGLTEIGGLLGRHKSTVSREIRRNPAYAYGTDVARNPRCSEADRRARHVHGLGYKASVAQRQAEARVRRPAAHKLTGDGPLRAYVLAGLRQRWSPRQITRRLTVDHPEDPTMRVSHETIYQALYVQARGNLREELKDQVALRSGRKRRRARPEAAGPVRSRRPWTEGWHISTRPAEAADRAIPGHWEGDLIIGKDGASAIITLVERTTRFVMLGALPDGRNSDHAVSVLSDLARRLPATLMRTVTWDNGSEIAQAARFTLATGAPMYFADPHSPWQRGSNENTNGLLRQYFPKGKADFRHYTQADLDAVADELNGRPRETLNWLKPVEKLNELLTTSTVALDT